MAQPKIAVLVVAAGMGVRAAGPADTIPKQYRRLGGRPVLARTLDLFLTLDAVTYVVAVINPDHRTHYESSIPETSRLLPPVPGAATRQASVRAGLRALAPYAPDLVLIHDAARPFTDTETIARVITALDRNDAALPTLPVSDTIKRSHDGIRVSGTEDRRELFAAQTPQGFRFSAIADAHETASALPHEFTDDAAIAEWAGLSVEIVAGNPENFKITHADDFARGERYLSGEHIMETRTGIGFDVHRFGEGDAVWLGGIEIPYSHRLEGHSDADVVLHALADAIYGAIGEGDIGQHFPPSDPQWRGAASRVFVEHAAELVSKRGGRIVNLDVTIVCEQPKIGPHVPAMRTAIASACSIGGDRIAVKASTNERLGFIGREEGIVAMATASIELPRFT